MHGADMSNVILPDSPVTAAPAGLTIGEAAAATGLSIDTIRYYERQGLLLDPTPRSSSGRRRFGDPELRWLAGLVMLRETGMSIADIRVVADLSRGEPDEFQLGRLLAELERHRARVLEDIQRARRHLHAIDRKITAYRRKQDEGRTT